MEQIPASIATNMMLGGALIELMPFDRKKGWKIGKKRSKRGRKIGWRLEGGRGVSH